MQIDIAQSETCASPPNVLAEAFKVPVSRAAAMKYLQFLVGQGYCWWHAGSVSLEKAVGFLEKMASLYPILATPNQRATAKKKRVASAFLVIFRDETRPNCLVWYLLATAGKRELDADGRESSAGPFRDLIHRRERMKCIVEHPLPWGDHFWLRRITRVVPPELKRHKRQASRQVWTWEMVPATVSAWTVRLEDAARHGYPDLRREFQALTRSPMFPGVRDQVIEIDRAAAVAWRRTHKSVYVSPLPNPLPWMGNVAMFRELTLWVLVEAMRRGKSEAIAAAEMQARDVIDGVEPPLHLTTVLTYKE